MANDIYREKTEYAEEKPQEVKVGDKAGTQEPDVEVPYTEYEVAHKHPFLVDYFKLGDTWQDKLGGFEKEVTLIEGYFKEQIEKGKLKNEKDAVEERLKSIYRLCNIDRSERTTMQIEKLSAYIEFLKKTDNIHFNNWRYGR